MSRLNYRVLLGTCLGLLLSACAQMPGKPTATTDYDHSYNFSRIHKIAIQPIAKATLSTMLMTDEQINRINQALHAELLHRGFDVVAVNAQADILLSWKFVPPLSDDTATFDPTATPIRGGTLNVTMIDPLRLQAVWRSTLHASLNEDADSPEAAQYRQQAAEAILAQFPPESAGN